MVIRARTAARRHENTHTRPASAFGFSCASALLLVLVALATPTFAAQGNCGQPLTTGNTPTATDALFILRTAVGLETCALCVCDVNDDGSTSATDSLLALRASIGIDVELQCPPCGAAECPGIAQFVLLAGTRGECVTNADCGGFPCDPSIGRCRTASELDNGWTGLAHDADVNDIVPARLVLDCQGPAPCGDCNIVDLDPALLNCRCAGDERTVCFNPFENDTDTCGGGLCQCYFGPPVPLSSGNIPTCLLNRVDAIGGTVDVDQGSGTIEMQLGELVYLGTSVVSPCPYCSDDPIPGDGNREGTCVGGQHDGMSCDAESANPTFPAPGGGRSSLDCFPSQTSNFSGQGLRVSMDLTTGRTELPADLPCGESPPFSLLDCPCRVCSGDVTQPCSSDAQCTALGAGACNGKTGVQPVPNQCTGTVCEDVGGGEGRCAEGPDDTYCDGVVSASRNGIILCNSNADCSAAAIGIDAGTCTLVQRRNCFPDPIVAEGAANPVAPRAEAAFCLGATTSTGINGVAGFPGPARLRYQSTVQLFCASDPAATYQPGVGGCPAPSP